MSFFVQFAIKMFGIVEEGMKVKRLIYKLQNRIAAESFYYEVINEICFTFFVYTYIIRVISIFRSKK